ncbi:MAG TPA: Fmu (Sun) domain-containing protein [Flavisolibacter sp.]|nr:Fmu (Sun) domain-containing protein [Flavisolibacter sp.]
MRSFSYLNTAGRILQSYDGQLPLAAWLKQYFREHKKFGSKDRKTISQLCYGFYRLGAAFGWLSTEEKILAGAFLFPGGLEWLIAEQRPEWKNRIDLPLHEKITVLQPNGIVQPFPFTDDLSREIDQRAFNESFFHQPDFFLRLRPGKENIVAEKLAAAGIAFERQGDSCLRLPSHSRADEVLDIDADAVVQDLSSQRVLEPLAGKLDQDRRFQVWDCCAASGGKSILARDLYPLSRLTVSDVRQSILINLRNRFQRAGIENYRHFVADLASLGFSISHTFDLVVCDAPCSGSGTWGRTPEQLSFFTPEKIGHYVRLQKAISVRAGKQLKKGGFLLYITCSVFAAENEEVVKHICNNLPVSLLSMQYFKGYELRADTLFAALFTAL